MPGAGYLGLPQPLSAAEVAEIRHIFALQATGALAAAAVETQHLTAAAPDTPLLGTILADRYLSPNAAPDRATLVNWLARFPDNPDAPSIRRLLLRLTPAPSVPRVASAPRALFLANRDGAAVAAVRAEPAPTADALMAGGLAAFRQNDAATARDLFGAAFRASIADNQRAAAALWAARSDERLADRAGLVTWLRRGARYAETFYGRIALRRLEALRASLIAHSTSMPTLGNADVESVLATDAGKRAFALLQVGQTHRAAEAFRGLWLDPAMSLGIRRAVLVLARVATQTDLTEDVALPPTRTAEPIHMPPLQPEDGFQVDPALVYAVVRHESNFQANLTSRSGAHGLMQLMPLTARAVGAMMGKPASRLHEPSVNLAVGQRYLLLLAADDVINGDMMRVLAAYAQGQSGLRRWVGAVQDGGDPLIFLESVPTPSTRSFIEDALLNAWRFADAMHRTPPGLDDLAAGRVPRLTRSASYPSVARPAAVLPADAPGAAAQ